MNVFIIVTAACYFSKALLTYLGKDISLRLQMSQELTTGYNYVIHNGLACYSSSRFCKTYTVKLVEASLSTSLQFESRLMPSRDVSCLQDQDYGSSSVLQLAFPITMAFPSCIRETVCRVYMCVQLCLTLCNPMNCSPPGFSLHGILQARILEWMPFPLPGDLPNLGTESMSLLFSALVGSTSEPPGKPRKTMVLLALNASQVVSYLYQLQ